MIDIKFNVPPYVDKAADYIQECVKIRRSAETVSIRKM